MLATTHKKPLKRVWNVRETARANLGWPWIRESNTNARDVTMTRRCRICTFHCAQGSFQPTFLSGVVEEDTPYLLCHVDFESHAQALRCQVCIIINSTA